MNENNPIVYSVIEKLHQQQEKGLQKYGAYVKTSSYDLKGWLQHGLEETLDLATYLETAIQLLQEQEQAFQARYDHHISQKYEAMAGFYEGWSSSTDARTHHALCASLVYQDALTAGFKLKTDSWLYKVGESLVKIVKTKDYDKQLEKMKKMAIEKLGDMPPIEDVDMDWIFEDESGVLN